MIRRKQSGIGKESGMLDSSSFRLPPNEIVVDNEDVGFRLVGKDKRKKWGERLLEKNESTRAWRTWGMNGFFQFLLLHMGIK